MASDHPEFGHLNPTPAASDPDRDPVLTRFRGEIASLDRAILAALNQRVQLVAQLREHKLAHGLSFHDPVQEQRVIAELRQANPGPLPDPALADLFQLIMTWSKRAAAGQQP